MKFVLTRKICHQIRRRQERHAVKKIRRRSCSPQSQRVLLSENQKILSNQKQKNLRRYILKAKVNIVNSVMQNAINSK